MDLANLSGGVGARRVARRVGRGNASGSGKTSGRGHRGVKARSGGKVSATYEGGQMPLYRRIPKFGFSSRKRRAGLNVFTVVNVSELERFEEGTLVDGSALTAAGFKLQGGLSAGFKVLGDGDIGKRLQVKVEAVSASARQKIEAAGGTVEIVGSVD